MITDTPKFQNLLEAHAALQKRVLELETENANLRGAIQADLGSKCSCGHQLREHTFLPSYYNCDNCSCDDFEKAV